MNETVDPTPEDPPIPSPGEVPDPDPVGDPPPGGEPQPTIDPDPTAPSEDRPRIVKIDGHPGRSDPDADL